MNTQSIFSLFLSLILCHNFALGQNDPTAIIEYSEKQTLEIASICVEGAPEKDSEAIKSIAGLREGQSIVIPSQTISRAIKNLLNLHLFEDVEIIQEKIDNEVIHLKIILVEIPILSRYVLRGVKKSLHDDVNHIIETTISKGTIVTSATKSVLKKKLESYFIKKGYHNATVYINDQPDGQHSNNVILSIDIIKDKKISIEEISFSGNHILSEKKIRKLLKNTKKRSTLFNKSKFVADDFEDDKGVLIAYYNSLGYRDANITHDTTWSRERDDRLMIHIDVDEGKPYYFGNISWKGNTLYTTEHLEEVLGIKPGDIYNPDLLETRLRFSNDGRDITSLYMDNGYLFFEILPIEKAIINNAIDIEIRITEGAQATINEVKITR